MLTSNDSYLLESLKDGLSLVDIKLLTPTRNVYKKTYLYLLAICCRMLY